MGDDSAIQWTDATWNPVTGCTKVSPGCAKCYIERTPPFRIAGRKFERGHIPLMFHPDRLDQPLLWKRPRMIFVNSLSDLFHPDVPDVFIDRVFSIMEAVGAGHHTFQVLTKRADRMQDYVRRRWGGTAIPALLRKNIWLGISVENQHWADKRIQLLLATPAAIRWVSYEPALGPVDFRRWLQPCARRDHMHTPERACWNVVNWIVYGGESGPGARPNDLSWARGALEQCRRAGTAFFMKQLGARPVGRGEDEQALALLQAMFGGRDPKGGDWTWWPEDLRVREYPAAA